VVHAGAGLSSHHHRGFSLRSRWPPDCVGGASRLRASSFRPSIGRCGCRLGQAEARRALCLTRPPSGKHDGDGGWHKLPIGHRERTIDRQALRSLECALIPPPRARRPCRPSRTRMLPFASGCDMYHDRRARDQSVAGSDGDHLGSRRGKAYGAIEDYHVPQSAEHPGRR